jgi:hypothetical protein
MMTKSSKSAPPAIPIAYRIRFEKGADTDGLVVGTFGEPYNMVAVADSIEIQEATTKNEASGDDSVTFVFAPAGSSKLSVFDKWITRSEQASSEFGVLGKL